MDDITPTAMMVQCVMFCGMIIVGRGIEDWSVALGTVALMLICEVGLRGIVEGRYDTRIP